MDVPIERAEAEVAAEEAQLDAELGRLDAAARELDGRLRRLRALVAEAAGVGSVPLDLAVRMRQAEQAHAPRLNPAAVRERAEALRREALEGRREAMRLLKMQMGQQQQQLKVLARQLADDEAVAHQHLSQVKAVAQKVAEAARQLEAQAAPPGLTPIGRVELVKATRREQPRVRMQVKIDFGSENNFYSGFSTNISDGGVFIATVKVAPIGTSMDLFFRLPNGDSVEATGVVRWVREVDDLQPEVLPGLGVQFVKLDERARAAILNFVKSREPMFFPD